MSLILKANHFVVDKIKRINKNWLKNYLMIEKIGYDRHKWSVVNLQQNQIIPINGFLKSNASHQSCPLLSARK